MRRPFAAIACLCLALFASTTFAQPKKAKPAAAAPAAEDVDAEAAQQRTVAISLVSSLADEARSFKDQTRRARVQARAADVLWDTDPERARELFKRAWEAAEIVDAESAKKRADEMKRLESEGEAVVVRGGPDLRSEVLRLVAKRDRKLGEEFLKALDDANEKERSEAATNQRRNDPSSRIGASQRLQLARRLVEDGEVERAIEFATPALNSINVDVIFFLSALHEKNAQLADSAYTSLLARAVRDSTSDANTVSGLSSYLFTPFLFQQVIHVLEIFHVPALVARHRNGLSIFLDGAVDDFLCATIVTEVDDFRPAGLNDPSHDVDGCIVPVEKGRSSYDPDFIFGVIDFGLFHLCKMQI